MKKAGEYSEEDTHRPAYYRLKVAASQAFGTATGQSVTHPSRKRRDETFKEDFTTGHPNPTTA